MKPLKERIDIIIESLTKISWLWAVTVKELWKEYEKAEANPIKMTSHEPGEPITAITCPCCGAHLEIEYGDDEGEISVIGTSAIERLEKKEKD